MRSCDAFIFDMNGTMIDDMRHQEESWYHILVNELKAGLSRKEVKDNMYGKNAEMFDRIFGPGTYSKEAIEAIDLRKESHYQQLFLPDLKLINGLDEFIKKAQAHHMHLAIGTGATPANVKFILDNLHIRNSFPVIVTANDVAVSKPHPEVFLQAAAQLGVSPGRCVVFEDSPKGIEAALRAGMKAIGVTSYHTAAELHSDNVLFTIADYTDPRLNELIR